MTPEKIRIAMAEACGWTRVEWYEDNSGPPILHGFPPTQVGYSATGDWQAITKEHTSHVPNYPEDLNAVHEAEKTLDRVKDLLPEAAPDAPFTQYDRYWGELGATCKGDVVHATAAQRCEAFLRTVGKWEE